MKNKQRGSTWLMVTLIVIVIIIIGVFILSKNNRSTQVQTSTATSTTQSNYVNSKYGFSLNFPASWTSYRVVESSNGSNPIINFGIKDQDGVFAISVLTKAQYAEYLKGDLQDSQLITQTDTNVYLWGHAQDYTDTVAPLRGDIPGIISTFKLN